MTLTGIFIVANSALLATAGLAYAGTAVMLGAETVKETDTVVPLTVYDITKLSWPPDPALPTVQKNETGLAVGLTPVAGGAARGPLSKTGSLYVPESAGRRAC